jgi:hypothetical protein
LLMNSVGLLVNSDVSHLKHKVLLCGTILFALFFKFFFTVLENLLPGVKYHVSVATSNKDSVPTEDIFKTRKRDLKKSNKKKNLKKSANKIVPQRRTLCLR